MPISAGTMMHFDKPPLTAAKGRSGSAEPMVSAVLVNFNAGSYLAAAVESLFAGDVCPGEVIVVDNASSDDSIAGLRSRVADGRLRVIEAGRNIGFAAGCNLGIRAAAGDVILLINPDCRIYP
jgi:GT2 family glycosyltransferase